MSFSNPLLIFASTNLFKNNQELTGLLFYTDTDSIFCSKELPLNFIGKELGKMKLEHTLTHFTALAPKVYGGKNKKGELVKIKGLKNPVSYKELKTLLILIYYNLNILKVFIIKKKRV